MNRKEHWEAIYRRAQPTEVSWYQAEAALSMRLIGEVMPDLDAPIIDIGGGASVLVSQLDAAGYTDVTVLDLSAAAIAVAGQRLGDRQARIHWLEGDVLTVELTAAHYRFWHDRAVFHFLTNPEERAKYVTQLHRAVAPGGYALIATFADDGPTRCSGLEVVRYSPDALLRQLGSAFTLMAAHREEHRTPSGAAQAFSYCLCRRHIAER